MVSGYMLLSVNVLFTLGTVPLALHYLSTDEFGLWALAAQIATSLALMDLGLSGATARIIIDYKDHPETGDYGSIIQTDVLVGLVQGGLILIIGTLLAFVIGPIMQTIPASLGPKLFWLIIGQSVIAAILFATRSITHVLTSHQRYDVFNYGGICGLLVNFGVMWWGFSAGIGVYAMLAGQAAGFIIGVIVNLIGCCVLKLLPKRGQWGPPTWARFHELFAFGRDYFFFVVGTQFVYASQTILLTRVIGLDAAALWSVYTKTYILVTQVIMQVFQYASTVLAEMIVQGDRERLLHRFKQVAVLCVNLAVAAGALFAICNSSFVQVWKAGKVFPIQWPPWNDLLLAIWLVISVAGRVHIIFAGQTKAFHFMRYIYYLEGLAFITLTVLLHRFGGITMMLGASIFSSLCFSLPYAFWRTRDYFHLSRRDLAAWHVSTLKILLTVALAALPVWWFTRPLHPLVRLVVESTVAGSWAAAMFLRYGPGAELRAEACRRAPPWARPILKRIGLAELKG